MTWSSGDRIHHSAFGNHRRATHTQTAVIATTEKGTTKAQKAAPKTLIPSFSIRAY